MSLEPFHILGPDGVLVADSPVSLERTRELYAQMVTGRGYDRKASAMQRQGRLATYAQFEGQEACQIGAVAPLQPADWLVATYRDAAAMWAHGYPWLNLVLGRTGDERGGQPPEGVNVLPPSITVGGHMIHAVGISWAEQIKGTDAVALTLFGDGATSEGDFHEAMNFAGVYRTPTVFVCQNNGWAISMPRDRQTASDTIAQKADAYGMPGVLVDGNDLLAVVAATTQAIARARRGDGATLIEALTYRMGPHTTTDDARRYRHDDDVAEWHPRDPLERVRRYLEAAGEWSEQWQSELEEAASQAVEDAVATAEAIPPFTSDEIFTAMYKTPTMALLEQQRLARRDEPR